MKASHARVWAALTSLTLITWIASAQLQQGTAHPQPDGSSIELPESFTIVELAADAVGKPGDDGATVFTQNMLNAKGTHEGVVCSFKITRFWREDATSQPIAMNADMAETITRAFPVGLSARGMQIEVVRDAAPFQVGQFAGWFCSLLHDKGSSRLDQYAFLVGPVLYQFSVGYSSVGADYWHTKAQEVIQRWRPTGAIGSKSGISRAGETTRWQIVKGPSNDTFAFPPSWVVIDGETPEETAREENVSISTKRLFNVRPNRFTRDIAVVHIIAVTQVAAKTGEPLPMSDADRRDWHLAMLDGVVDRFEPAADVESGQVGRISILSSRMRATSAASVPLECTVISFGHGERLYVAMVTHSPGEHSEWRSTFNEVMRRSSVGQAQSHARIEKRSEDPPKVAPIGPATGSQARPASPGPLRTAPPATGLNKIELPLLIASFAITWGVGLTPPLLIRFLVWRRPLRNVAVALLICLVFFMGNFALSELLGSASKGHTALYLVGAVSFCILRSGAPRTSSRTACPP